MNQFITPSPQVVFFPFLFLCHFDVFAFTLSYFIIYLSLFPLPVLLTCCFRLVILPQNVVPMSWEALL
ncbi:uncharacterized protein BO88DRAFT_215898 [Aspergillus vadensis CBS 113365]|uniref:Uncharacterized protein n=1 Tax=Aspergillus vadensis (strain CBS 113365 / IMI 142717 / IBT 24658) TaxID=1448311 RepID=A0A319BI83_ASPVC|nr:hypothetical protein BO88DRAFT_215898 [Aspergillus vadensis CBS 113365]PYH72445.1 hypothetical protein BO88DRAFT_215898 [Aspergillus vadensis CBS 113365]